MDNIIVIKIRDDFGNVLVVGTLDSSTGVFRTDRKRSKHFFVKYGGWALDRKVAEGIDAKVFELLDKDSGKLYTITKEEFLKRSVPISNKGHREQLCLAEFEWEVQDPSKKEKHISDVMKAYKGGW